MEFWRRLGRRLFGVPRAMNSSVWPEEYPGPVAPAPTRLTVLHNIKTVSHTASTQGASDIVLEPRDAVLMKLRERIAKLRGDIKPDLRETVDRMVADTEHQIRLVPLACEASRIRGDHAMRFNDVVPFVYNLQEFLMHRDPELSLVDALTRAKQGVNLKCPKCGQFTPGVLTSLLAYGGHRGTFAGRGAEQAARLASGQCPICCGESVTVTVDPGNMIDRRPRIQNHMEYIRSFDYKDRLETRDWQKIDELKDVPKLANGGRTAEASERLNTSLERYGDLDFVHAWIGILLEKQGKVDKARDAYMKGLRASREKHYLCEKMGDLELKHGAVEDALMWFLASVLGQLHSKRVRSEGPWLYLAHTALIIENREAGHVLYNASKQGPQSRYGGGVDLSGEAHQDLSQKLSNANQAAIRELISEAARLTQELGLGI
jgi:tetratricopeptide (TPR) repeat protein